VSNSSRFCVYRLASIDALCGAQRSAFQCQDEGMELEIARFA
jgi:hypothetical protein